MDKLTAYVVSEKGVQEFHAVTDVKTRLLNANQIQIDVYQSGYKIDTIILDKKDFHFISIYEDGKYT